jgi:protein tyrosine phosphatase type 4A
MNFTVIEYNEMRFIIMDAPTDKNFNRYLSELKKENVTHIFRVCESSYNIENFKNNGINVTTLPFPDGEFPPDNIVRTWLDLVKQKSQLKETIAVHCVAGLGRAPVLVAIALIESGMNALDAISYIREKRKGSINTKQLKYLELYKKNNKKCIII